MNPMSLYLILAPSRTRTITQTTINKVIKYITYITDIMDITDIAVMIDIADIMDISEIFVIKDITHIPQYRFFLNCRAESISDPSRLKKQIAPDLSTKLELKLC